MAVAIRPPARVRLTGAILEVKDLAATRAFYEPIFHAAGGRWSQDPKGLAFAAGRHRIEFVRKARPRVTGKSAQHHAFRVGRHHAAAVAETLAQQGHEVQWWHEDHPSEREIAPYALDPSGNWIQLVAQDPDGAVLDHLGGDYTDLEYAEDFYTLGLGGSVGSFHGWGDEPDIDLKAWSEGDDPCAPWTRYTRFSFRSRTDEAHATPQLFIEFGDSRVGLFLARGHNQEPPEDVLRDSPRVRLQTDAAASEYANYLAGPARAGMGARYTGRKIDFQVEGPSVHFRDPGGNYVEVGCNRE